jgi:hypothetical protein
MIKPTFNRAWMRKALLKMISTKLIRSASVAAVAAVAVAVVRKMAPA